MKKLTLSVFVLFNVLVTIAQNDRYAGVTDSYDGDGSGASSKYGWLLIVVLIIAVYFNNQKNTKKR